MDLHRRRSVLVRMTQSGERLETVRILNDADRLATVIARAGGPSFAASGPVETGRHAVDRGTHQLRDTS
jgi:hypothetical protein